MIKNLNNERIALLHEVKNNSSRKLDVLTGTSSLTALRAPSTSSRSLNFEV